MSDLAYYHSLPYPITLVQEEGDWFATIPLLPGCVSDGPTPNEAIKNLRDAQAGWLEVALRNGEAIPEP